VLVNEHTASSAEIVSGALQANKLAVVLGTRTHGKASVQELVRLDDGTGIRLTTAFYHLPDGRNIHKRPGETTWGVDPNDGFFVPMSPAQGESYRQWLRDRERLGGVAPIASERPSIDNPELSARDPQLAAGWKAMRTRLADGEFKPVGGTTEQLKAFVEQRELAARRGELVSQLEQVSKELRELDSTLGAALTSP
jgi:carboxyl-terminal processing protease